MNAKKLLLAACFVVSIGAVARAEDKIKIGIVNWNAVEPRYKTTQDTARMAEGPSLLPYCRDRLPGRERQRL